IGFVGGHFFTCAQRRRGNAEAQRLSLSWRIGRQQRHNFTNHAQAARFIRVQNPAEHGPPRLGMEQVRETLGLVAEYGELAVLHQMRNALLLQDALRELRERKRDESIQLRLVLSGLLQALGGDDAAGANVKPDWGTI